MDPTYLDEEDISLFIFSRRLVGCLGASAVVVTGSKGGYGAAWCKGRLVTQIALLAEKQQKEMGKKTKVFFWESKFIFYTLNHFVLVAL